MLLIKTSKNKLASTCKYFRWPICLLIWLAICMSGMAKADCWRSSGAVFHYTANLPSSMQVPLNAAVGTVLYDPGWVNNGGGAMVTCTWGNNIKYTFGSNYGWAVEPGYSDIYQTGVPGIGIRVYGSNNMSGGGARAFKPSPGVLIPFDDGAGGATHGPLPSFRVQLLVTGPVSAGTTNMPIGSGTSAVGHMYYGPLETGSVSLSNNITFTVPTCTVTTPANRTVTMPVVATSSFPTVGSTAGNGSFTISLSCAGNTQVYMTMTDAGNAFNRSNLLLLAAGSTATGIAYRIRHANGLVAYGADSSTPGNSGQFWVAQSSGSGPNSIDIPFAVQYIRTGTVGAGTANAAVTYTMSYQ